MAAPDSSRGVSTLELFFDLVFVFTITQLTNVLVHEPSWKGLLQVALMLGLIFWMYGGYAWLTNSVAVDRVTRRLMLLGGMAGFFIVALAVPRAFSTSGAGFGLAYLAVVLIHMGMFARSSQVTVVRAITGLVPSNLSTALMVVGGGLSGGTAAVCPLGAAFAFEWISPKLIDDSGFVIEPSHFVERHGLVVLVAIGESVVAVGIGAAGLPIDAALAAAAILGLGLSACLWWAHFGNPTIDRPRRPEPRAMAQRPRLAISAFGYWHLLLLLGIVAIAFALKSTTGHAFSALALAQAVALGGGVALFLLGEALFRHTLELGGERGRGLCAMLALSTIPVGRAAAALQLAALVGLFVAMLANVDRQSPARLTS